MVINVVMEEKLQEFGHLKPLAQLLLDNKIPYFFSSKAQYISLPATLPDGRTLIQISFPAGTLITTDLFLVSKQHSSASFRDLIIKGGLIATSPQELVGLSLARPHIPNQRFLTFSLDEEIYHIPTQAIAEETLILDFLKEILPSYLVEARIGIARDKRLSAEHWKTLYGRYKTASPEVQDKVRPLLFAIPSVFVLAFLAIYFLIKTEFNFGLITVPLMIFFIYKFKTLKKGAR